MGDVHLFPYVFLGGYIDDIDIPAWPDPQVMTKTAQVIHPLGTELGVLNWWSTASHGLKNHLRMIEAAVFIIKYHSADVILILWTW